MIVLGYNGFSRSAELFSRLYGHTPDSVDRYAVAGHDASAALVIDGEVVAAVEEERLNRQRKTSDFPRMAIRWCLQHAGISFRDVDYFAVGWNFDDGYWQSSGAQPAEFRDALYAREALLDDFATSAGYAISSEQLVCVPHHLAHLSCGRAFSGDGDAAFFISDGKAETNSAIMGAVRAGEVTMLDDLTVDDANSLAFLYQNVTRYLGFLPNSDEYKVMGLAGLGAPPDSSVNPFLARLIALEGDGRFSIAMPGGLRSVQAYYSLLDDLFDGDEERRALTEFRVGVASAVQQAIEVVTAHQVRALASRTGMRRLLFEGGLALNCVNNAKLLEDLPFDEVEVSCAAGDSGISIGAAAHVHSEKAGKPALSKTPYLGPSYSQADMHSALAAHESELTWLELSLDSLLDATVELLRDKAVVGWFQGRVEYGARALGNRSILADPSDPTMKDIINHLVKHREPFRPFAPVVMEDDAASLFGMGKKARSPYMTFVFHARPDRRDKIVAATHVDGTSRVQTVTDQSNPRFAGLLRRFHRRTGVPCLINTSFNVAGQPIVCSPLDALQCFLATELDALVLGDFLVTKVDNGPAQR